MARIGINIATGSLHKKEMIVGIDLVRTIAEAQMEAQQLLDNTTLFMMKYRSFLIAEEVESTNNAIKELNMVMKSVNKDEIYSATEKLNEILRPYAERLMNK